MYEQALPFRDGLKKGLTYKAIAQTLIFLSDALGEPIAEERLKSAVFDARTLLLKHPDPKHLESIHEIVKRKNYVSAEMAVIRDPKILSLLDELTAASQSGSEFDGVAESNGRALAELRRALTYRLQFALYLRNFSHSDIKHQIGQPFRIESSTAVTVVEPTVTYSIVDHKLLSLFPEGVVAIASPNSSIFSRLTLIPMFSLSNQNWQKCVPQIMSFAPRIVMLFDELTDGVEFELEQLIHLGLTDRTFIITGQAYRTGKSLPPVLTSGIFKYVGDWLDVSYNETHPDQDTKAHGLIQPFLGRFLTSKALETGNLITAWLKA